MGNVFYFGQITKEANPWEGGSDVTRKAADLNRMVKIIDFTHAESGTDGAPADTQYEHLYYKG
jgi:hypothetical protein